MNEKQFLEMSDRRCDKFIHKHVFKLADDVFVNPYTASWKELGAGIEHANENGWYVHLTGSPHDKDNRVALFKEESMTQHELRNQENIFLAFWIAYMKALGVLE